MPRGDLSEHVSRVKKLALEMNKFVPIGDTQTSEFRSDLAGLYVVAVAAAYESCVKEVLVSYAARNNEMFGQFALANYKKLNSRINMNDLHKYAKTFHPSIGKKFQDNLTLTKDKINRKLGRDIQKSYEQILSWRHDFAHAGRRNTTIEEAMTTHQYALRVIYCFDNAFR